MMNPSELYEQVEETVREEVSVLLDGEEYDKEAAWLAAMKGLVEALGERDNG